MKSVVSLPIITITLLSQMPSVAFGRETLLDPIIINSSRIPTAQDYSITNTIVIDRQAIDASAANNVSELLRSTAGVHVQQNGSRGAIGSVFLRNNDPNFVVVIIDGVKVNDPTNSRGGSFDFSSIDLNSVERIEIVKGTMSSIQGSDALSGAIYITTRAVSEENEAQAKLTTGSNDFQEASAQLQQRLAQTDVSLNAVYLDEGEQVAYSGFINRSINLNTDSYYVGGRKVSFRGRYNESDARSLPDDSGGEQYAVIRESELRQIRESSIGLTYKHDVSSEASFTVSVSSFVHDERVDSPGVAPGVRDPFGIPANSSDSTFRRHYLIWNNNIELSADVQLSIGLDIQREYGRSDSVLDTGFGLLPGYYRLKRNNQAVFTEALFAQEDHFTVTAGLRYDMPTEFSSETTANLGVRYGDDRYAVTATVGSGYKLPSFFALGNPIVGNANLSPEKSQFWEAGFKLHTVETVEWHFNVYAYTFEDLIDFDAGPPPALVNRSRVKSEGAELGFRQQLATGNAVSAELAYSETNIVGTNEKLLNRPRWKATGHFHYQINDAVTGVTTLVYVDEVYESSVATGDVVLDAYARLDLSLNWRVSKIWLIGGAVENITDSKYQETVGTDSPGISARLSIAAKL